MICSCASQTRRSKEEEPPFVLRFESCPTCGRCDRFVLLERGVTALVGEAARRFFSCHRRAAQAEQLSRAGATTGNRKSRRRRQAQQTFQQ